MMLERLSNLQQRVVSGVVMAAVVLALTVLGGVPFRLLAIAIAAAMFFEWIAMTPGGLRASRIWIGGMFAVAIAVVLFGASPLIGLLAGIALGGAAAAMAETRGQGLWVGKGFAYAFLTGFALAELRGDSQSGLVAVLFLYAVVWATDICAYFVGRAIGGPRLAPSISPAKTWSGAAGGMVGALIAGLLLAAVAGGISFAIFALAILLSLASQLGDLFESAIKRQAGVKDSSHLIPGHGGVMDRVDGLAVAAMTFYLLGVLGGNAAEPARSFF